MDENWGTPIDWKPAYVGYRNNMNQLEWDYNVSNTINNYHDWYGWNSTVSTPFLASLGMVYGFGPQPITWFTVYYDCPR